jgi:hypothetical protein
MPTRMAPPFRLELLLGFAAALGWMSGDGLSSGVIFASLCRPPENGALRRDDRLQAVPGFGATASGRFEASVRSRNHCLTDSECRARPSHR